MMCSPSITRLAAATVLVMVTVFACGHGHSSLLEDSLDRAEALLEILEGVEDESDAETAAAAVQDWLRGCGLHDQRTAELESISGQAYVRLLEQHRSRSDDLRRRMDLQFDRLSTDSYLEPYAAALRNVRDLIPPPLPR